VISYHQKLARVLDAMGGIYHVDDLLTAIGENRMQSFAVNNTWAITQVNDFPRAKQLQVVAMVGDRDDFEPMHAAIVDYADRNNVGLISAYGRRGWMPWALSHGWKIRAKNLLYHKEL
jgi:hypothetical protein